MDGTTARSRSTGKDHNRIKRVVQGLAVFLLLVLLFLTCGWFSLWAAPLDLSADTRSKLTGDYQPWPDLNFEPLDPAIIMEIAHDTGVSDSDLRILNDGGSSFWEIPDVTSTTNPAVEQTATLSAVTSTASSSTLTPMSTLTLTPDPSQSPTATVTDTATPTATSTATITATATMTATPTASLTPTHTQAPTLTHTPTATQTPTVTITPTVTLTPIPSETPIPTNTPIPTATASCWGDDPPGGLNLGAPDGAFLTLACGQSYVVDLGSNPIVTQAGYDFVYYERLAFDIIYMDSVIVEVCTDADCSTGYTVFDWGNGSLDTNTNIGASGYTPGEPDNTTIPVDDLYGSWPYPTGIAIDVDAVAPGGTYRYVRISSPVGGDSDGSEIDALQVLP
jgi:hypothetical protein